MVDVQQLNVLLKLLHTVGGQLADTERGAYHRAWGRHLLEDGRGLALVAQRLEALDGAAPSQATTTTPGAAVSVQAPRA